MNEQETKRLMMRARNLLSQVGVNSSPEYFASCEALCEELTIALAQQAASEVVSEEYAAKRFADGVNAAVADMLPELERMRAALASETTPTLASLIERFGNVPGELEVCGEVPGAVKGG